MDTSALNYLTSLIVNPSQNPPEGSSNLALYQMIVEQKIDSTYFDENYGLDDIILLGRFVKYNQPFFRYYAQRVVKDLSLIENATFLEISSTLKNENQSESVAQEIVKLYGFDEKYSATEQKYSLADAVNLSSLFGKLASKRFIFSLVNEANPNELIKEVLALESWRPVVRFHIELPLNFSNFNLFIDTLSKIEPTLFKQFVMLATPLELDKEVQEIFNCIKNNKSVKNISYLNLIKDDAWREILIYDKIAKSGYFTARIENYEKALVLLEEIITSGIKEQAKNEQEYKILLGNWYLNKGIVSSLGSFYYNYSQSQSQQNIFIPLYAEDLTDLQKLAVQAKDFFSSLSQGEYEDNGFVVPSHPSSARVINLSSWKI